MLFSDLGLSAGLLRAVADQGYAHPTPVQASAIPLILEGRDVLARAQTGTGKTAGFALPILQRLSATSRCDKARVRCLILAPTRELAAQIEASVRQYGAHTRLKSLAVFGGVSLRPQVAALRNGVDIVIATPGRLLDHLAQRTIDLSHVEILVLDEADRMLDMGFIHDIRRVLKALPREKQSLLFSATFAQEIRQLASGLMSSPAEVVVAPEKPAADLVEQRVYLVDRERKRALLADLITSGGWRQVLVFTRTKHGANRLAAQLETSGLRTAAIHGNKSQGARTKALTDFKRGAVRVLVATDIAARGLDIVELPHVVNFELPQAPEDYVHRIGRTGRAGLEGAAISLVCKDELVLLRGVEAFLKRKLDPAVVPGFEPERGAQHARSHGGGHRSRPEPGVGRRWRPENNDRARRRNGQGDGKSGARDTTKRYP